MSLTLSVVETIRARRLALKLSRSSINKSLGMNENYMKKIEGGERKNLGLDELAAIGKLVGVELTLTINIKEDASF